MITDVDLGVVLEITAVSGSSYFFSAVADVVMLMDLAEMTAVSGLSYFFSAAADAAMATTVAVTAADVMNAAKLNTRGETSTHRARLCGWIFSCSLSDKPDHIFIYIK